MDVPRILRPGAGEGIVLIWIVATDSLNVGCRAQPLRQIDVDVGVQIEASKLFLRVHAALIEVRDSERVRAQVAHAARSTKRIVRRRR